jgi:hypothetical protein
MGILDEINNMRNQGIDEKSIIANLQERGVKPKAIQEAFNQMRIKKAVSSEAGEEGMEPSIMKEGMKSESELAPPLYIPKTQEINHESEIVYEPNSSQTSQFNEDLEAPQFGQYNQEEYVPQEGYDQQEARGYDTDTFIEIAEQVFSEKIKKEQKQLDSLNEFAILTEARISNDHERIKRMETIIDRLQASILEKVGSYGRNLESIKNEMGMMQESFQKMVPEIHERNERNIPHEHHHEQREYPHERSNEEQKERTQEREMNWQEQKPEHHSHVVIKKIHKKK